MLSAVFLLLVTLLALPTYAQEALWKELIGKADTLYQQGRYSEGIKVTKDALKVAEDTFGPDHPNLATSLNNLAGLYEAQGKYAAAEPLYKRALVIYEKVLGPDHPNVAITLNNLAGLYRAQGQYAAAEPLYKQALDILEKTVGPDHPYLAGPLNNLAELYRAQGKYAEAEPLYKRALAILEKTLGPDYPNVATTLQNMAGLYRETGRVDEAKELEAQAKEIRSGARQRPASGRWKMKLLPLLLLFFLEWASLMACLGCAGYYWFTTPEIDKKEAPKGFHKRIKYVYGASPKKSQAAYKWSIVFLIIYGLVLLTRVLI